MVIEIINPLYFSFVGNFNMTDKNTVITSAVNDNVKDYKDKILIFDFDKLEYLNSIGIGLIVRIDQDVKERGGRINIINVNENIMDLFEICNLSKELCIKKKMDKFLFDII